MFASFEAVEETIVVSDAAGMFVWCVDCPQSAGAHAIAVGACVVSGNAVKPYHGPLAGISACNAVAVNARTGHDTMTRQTRYTMEVPMERDAVVGGRDRMGRGYSWTEARSSRRARNVAMSAAREGSDSASLSSQARAVAGGTLPRSAYWTINTHNAQLLSLSATSM